MSLRLRERAAQGRQPDSVGFRRRLYVGRDLCEVGLRRFESLPDRFFGEIVFRDRKSTRLNSSHSDRSRMPSSA